MSKEYDEQGEKIQSLLLIDGSAGIYVPKEAAEEIDLLSMGIDQESIDILLQGPPGGCFSDEDGAEFYWETWEEVLNNARHVDENGMEWFLYQEQDLFLLRDDFDFEAAGWL